MKFFVRRVFNREQTSPWGDPLPEYEFEVRRRFLLWSYVIDRVEEFDRRSEQLIQLIEKNKDAIIRLKASRNAP
jgi:hypothetical protein